MQKLEVNIRITVLKDNSAFNMPILCKKRFAITKYSHVIKNTIKEYTPVLLKGTVNIRNDEKSLMIDQILDVNQVKLNKDLEISICDEIDKERLAEFKDLLNRNPGKNIIKIYYGDRNDGKFIIKKVALSEELNEFIRKYKC